MQQKMGAQLDSSELSALLKEVKDPLESTPAEAADELSKSLNQGLANTPSEQIEQPAIEAPSEQIEQPTSEASQPADIKENNYKPPNDVEVPTEDNIASPSEKLSPDIKEDKVRPPDNVQVSVGDTGMSPPGNASPFKQAKPIGADLPIDALDDPSRILFQRETELPVDQLQPSAAKIEKPVEMKTDASSLKNEDQKLKESAETSPNKRLKRDVQCEFCAKQQAKYRCPGCGTQTCSLECSKGHKKQTGCKGQRVKTAMVAIGEFDENNLISDYNFLEETLRQNEAARRLGRNFQAGPFFRHPPRLMQLITQARNRRIELILLPVDMSRRKENTSFYDKRRKCFYWRVEWRFPSAELQLVTPKMDEHQTPLAALNALLEPRPGNAATRHKLREYCALGTDKLTFLLRKDCCKAPEPVYIKLDPAKRLRSLLEGKTLIEFPVLTLALPSELERYTIVEDTVNSSEPAWESSSGRDAQSEDNRLPRAHLHQETGGVGIPSEQPDESGPPEEAPIVRARNLEGSGYKQGEARDCERIACKEDEARDLQENRHKQEGNEEFPLELAALLGQAAMADFHRKRKATDLEPGEIAGEIAGD